jgi:hypothetical protein
MTSLPIVLSARPHICGIINILMFVLALADGLFCAWFICPLLCWYKCPEIGTSSTDWAQLSRVYLKTEIESSLRNVACFK